jgi:hypothetical protein
VISNIWKRLFQAVVGLTGIIETLLGLLIIFFAAYLQTYIDTGILPEPLYLRILGVMDFYIGVAYIYISFKPDKYYILNKGTWGYGCLRQKG